MNFWNVRVSPRSKELVNQVLSGDWLGEGPMVTEFERRLMGMGLSNPVTVNSGTAALHLALVIAGVGVGDEVIIPAQTFPATAMAIKMVGATPVFADIDPRTGNISPADIMDRATLETKAIIPVHYGGLPCDMADLQAIGTSGLEGIEIIEDAAHAPGAVYRGQPIGSLSRFTAFSFQAIKHITTGDGGVLCCLIQEDADEARRRRWFGIDRNSPNAEEGNREYLINEVGYKYHMNDIAAAIGLGNLEEFKTRLERRQSIGALYRLAMTDIPGLELLRLDPDRSHAYWTFTVLVENRLDFIRAMRLRGVPASVLMRRIDAHPIFGGKRGDLPGTDYFDEHQVSLPCHDALTTEEIYQVITAVKEGW